MSEFNTNALRGGQLPIALQNAIEKVINLSGSSFSLQQARRDLTAQYQAQTPHILMRDKEARLSYIATRMPATYAVIYNVLENLRIHQEEITSLLDLGAGPATVLWGAHSLFPRLNRITMVEKDSQLKQLATELFDETIKKKHIMWILEDLGKSSGFVSHSLVTLSYILGELSLNKQKSVLEKAWQATERFLVVIEPGTPTGFKRIRQLRTYLIQQGAFIHAPCPHNNVCPINEPDWCHFKKRLRRSSFHRFIKEAVLPYEDEKFSYLIAAKEPLQRSYTRIIRQPQRGKGHFILDLCTSQGLKRDIISRKMKDVYSKARHLEWGDEGPSLNGEINE